MHFAVIAVHVAPGPLGEFDLAGIVIEPAEIVVLAHIAGRKDGGHRVVDERIEAHTLPRSQAGLGEHGRGGDVFLQLRLREVGHLVAVNGKLTHAAVTAGSREPQVARLAGTFKLHPAPCDICIRFKAPNLAPIVRLAVIDLPRLYAVRIEKAKPCDNIIRTEVDVHRILAEFRLPVGFPVAVLLGRVPLVGIDLGIVRRCGRLVLIVKEHLCGV